MQDYLLECVYLFLDAAVLPGLCVVGIGGDIEEVHMEWLIKDASVHNVAHFSMELSPRKRPAGFVTVFQDAVIITVFGHHWVWSHPSRDRCVQDKLCEDTTRISPRCLPAD